MLQQQTFFHSNWPILIDYSPRNICDRFTVPIKYIEMSPYVCHSIDSCLLLLSSRFPVATNVVRDGESDNNNKSRNEKSINVELIFVSFAFDLFVMQKDRHIIIICMLNQANQVHKKKSSNMTTK